MRVLRLGRRWGSPGSSTVEYGLIVALIGGVLCLGIGVTVKSVFQETISCFLANLKHTSAAGCDSGGSDGGGGAGGSGDTAPGPAATESPSPTESPAPTDSPAATDSQSPTDTPSAGVTN